MESLLHYHIATLAGIQAIGFFAGTYWHYADMPVDSYFYPGPINIRTDSVGSDEDLCGPINKTTPMTTTTTSIVTDDTDGTFTIEQHTAMQIQPTPMKLIILKDQPPLPSPRLPKRTFLKECLKLGYNRYHAHQLWLMRQK